VSAKELPDTITVGNDPVGVKGETSTPVQPILTKRLLYCREYVRGYRVCTETSSKTNRTRK
jgi:hypothetical protein